MTAEIGHYALILALCIATAQGFVPLYGAYRRDFRLMVFSRTAALAQFLLLSLAAACLVSVFVSTDLSVRTVVMNSNSNMPMLYKVTASWGNHEGSLLLWTLILATFGAGLALSGAGLPASLKARTLAVQGLIGAAFLALMVFTSDPFARVYPAPFDGQELNPLLQDVGLAFHPPFLYLGYVGFSVTFAFAVAALIEGQVDASWARYVRPWTLAAWCFLTIGITMGSFWAYYELGWGGWWFWDPVENASFMPWIVGTALLHSALVAERRQTLLTWTILLAILAFSLSLIGTFLVRSGVLTSVHAFASDPSRGIGVLLILAGATGGALMLFAARAQTLNRQVAFLPVSREGGLVLNNILLVTAAATVFLGTFYPLLADLAWGVKLSVGPPYFNRTFVPLMAPLLLAVSVGAVLNWKRDRLLAAVQKLRVPAMLAGVAVAGVLALGGGLHLLAAFGIGLAIWVVAGAIWILVRRARLFSVPVRQSFDILRRTPLSVYGMVMAHAGLGFAVAGITAVSTFETEHIITMRVGSTAEIAGYEVRLDRVALLNGPNYEAEQGRFTILRNNTVVTKMKSEHRFFPVSQSLTTEAGIRPFFLSNLYIALGQRNESGGWVVRLYHHPFVLLIWLGPALMALGGVTSLADRRYRVGAPRPTALRAEPAEA